MPNETIMVVEDSPTYLRQISDLLQDRGYHTITAIDGEDAMEKVNSRISRLIRMTTDHKLQ